MGQLYEKVAKIKEKWYIFNRRYLTQPLKVLQIWLDIRIALEMYIGQIMPRIFFISNPSPQKMVSNLGNISKIAIFSNIIVNERLTYAIYKGVQVLYLDR